jgi:hypothetical protein
MNAELEGLVLALDAVLQARAGGEAEQMEKLFQSRLDEVLLRRRGLSRERLMSAVDLAHKRWLRAQDKPSTMPPKA